MTPTFTTASAADLDIIGAMLSTSDLPIDDVDEHVAEFILAKSEGATVGTVAVEYTGQAALLRSLCVAPSHRRHAVGARLLASIESEGGLARRARALSADHERGSLLEHHGFSRTSCADAPPGIRSTAQFLTLCPPTAVCIPKTLPSSSNGQTGSP